eukprot:6258388-Amphidinium_carterae.1
MALRAIGQKSLHSMLESCSYSERRLVFLQDLKNPSYTDLLEEPDARTKLWAQESLAQLLGVISPAQHLRPICFEHVQQNSEVQKAMDTMQLLNIARLSHLVDL